jgi:hypothetical protein
MRGRARPYFGCRRSGRRGNNNPRMMYRGSVPSFVGSKSGVEVGEKKSRAREGLVRRVQARHGPATRKKSIAPRARRATAKRKQRPT